MFRDPPLGGRVSRNRGHSDCKSSPLIHHPAVKVFHAPQANSADPERQALQLSVLLQEGVKPGFAETEMGCSFLAAQGADRRVGLGQALLNQHLAKQTLDLLAGWPGDVAKLDAIEEFFG